MRLRTSRLSRIRSATGRLCSLILSLSCLAGCQDDSAKVDERKSIEPVRGNLGLVGRSIVHCPAGDCIVLHFPPSETLLLREEGSPDSPYHLDNMLKTVLNAEDSNPSNDGTILPVPDRWGGADADRITLATFNCGAYAVGELLDLHEGDWIDTRSRADTQGTIPFQIVLESYFQEIARFPIREIEWNQIADSTEIRPADLLCLMQKKGEQSECVHVGRIQQKNGRNWLESKIGRGPIVLSTIESAAAAYSPAFDEIVIYRENRSE